MRQKLTDDLTTGSLTKKILTFAAPVMLTSLIQQLYGAADSAVVGRFAGSIALAAVGSTNTPTNMLLQILWGLSIGCNVMCARYRGAGDNERLSKCMHTSILLAFFSGILVGVIGFFLAEPILQLMGLSENIIGQATAYMKIIFMGTPASMLFNFTAGILRAHGDSRRPLRISMAAGVANVLLNLFFVIVLRLDAVGVAIATVLSQVLTAVLGLWILFDPKGEYRMEVRKLRIDRSEMFGVIRFGVPTALNGLAFSAANMILQSAVFTFPDVTVAGVSAAQRITSFLYVVVNSFYNVTVNFSAQCSGKRDYKRIDRVLIRSILLAMGTLAVCGCFISLFTVPVLMIFTDELAVAEAGAEQLRVMAWAYILYSGCEAMLGAVRGMGKSTVPMLINVGSICLPRLVWIYFVFPQFRTLQSLYLCYPVSYLIAAVNQTAYYIHCRRQVSRTNEALPETGA